MDQNDGFYASKSVIHSARLGIELTNGNNGRGRKWFSSAKTRKLFEAKFAHLKRPTFEHVVSLRVTRVMGPKQRPWDADSWQRGNLKEIIDSLVGIGWFYDDSRKYIDRIMFDEKRGDQPDTIVDVLA